MRAMLLAHDLTTDGIASCFLATSRVSCLVYVCGVVGDTNESLSEGRSVAPGQLDLHR